MMTGIGPDEIIYWGANTRFRRVNDIWHREVGLGNWARVSEPILGEAVGTIMRRNMVFYGDPTLRMLRWTEYEDVGALSDTFFAVFESVKETNWYEMSNALRVAFEASDDKAAFPNVSSPERSVRYTAFGARDGKHDRSRDNPACVIYVTDSRPS